MKGRGRERTRTSSAARKKLAMEISMCTIRSGLLTCGVELCGMVLLVSWQC